MKTDDKLFLFFAAVTCAKIIANGANPSMSDQIDAVISGLMAIYFAFKGRD